MGEGGLLEYDSVEGSAKVIEFVDALFYCVLLWW